MINFFEDNTMNYNNLDFTNTSAEYIQLENCIINNFDSASFYKKNYLISIIGTLALNTLYNYMFIKK